MKEDSRRAGPAAWPVRARRVNSAAPRRTGLRRAAVLASAPELHQAPVPLSEAPEAPASPQTYCFTSRTRSSCLEHRAHTFHCSGLQTAHRRLSRLVLLSKSTFRLFWPESALRPGTQQACMDLSSTPLPLSTKSRCRAAADTLVCPTSLTLPVGYVWLLGRRARAGQACALYRVLRGPLSTPYA